MENAHPNTPETAPESHTPEEALAARIDALPAELGFVETEELAALRPLLQEAYEARNAEVAGAVIAEYQRIGMDLVDAIDNRNSGEAHNRARIGLFVAIGLLRRDIGRQGSCLDDLDDALLYAERMGFEDIVAVIEEAIREMENDE